MDEIIWKTVVYNGETYNNLEVSTDGRLRNVKTGTVYKHALSEYGYWQVCISLGSRNKKKLFKIHKAVAETFIPNPKNKEEVNHKDGDKNNNNVSNLEWVTSSENKRHAYENGLMKPLYGINNGASKLTQDDIKYIREHYVSRDPIYGARALARKFGIDHTCILDIINGISYINI